MSQKDNEFYIGWMREAPGSYGATLRKCLHFLIVLVVLIAAVITLKQKPFSTASFDFVLQRLQDSISAMFSITH